MIELLSSLLPSLLGGFGGLLGAALPQIIEIFRAPQRLAELQERNSHELRMLDKSIEQSKVEQAGRLQESLVQAEMAVDVERQKSHAQITTKASQWVINFSACIRPAITLGVFLVWALVKYSVVVVATREGVPIADAAIAMWDGESQAILTAIVVFWFGGRYLNDKRREHAPAF